MTLSKVTIPSKIQQLGLEGHSMGQEMVYLALDGVLEGVIELQPTMLPEAEALVAALHERDVGFTMISADQEAPTKTLTVTAEGIKPLGNSYTA